VAVGADALLIDVHPSPAQVRSEGAQQAALEVCANNVVD
jgi:3-deoxy-D-arabino-heptulosonate 7-phosphate (DAHP) synthase